MNTLYHPYYLRILALCTIISPAWSAALDPALENLFQQELKKSMNDIDPKKIFHSYKVLAWKKNINGKDYIFKKNHPDILPFYSKTTGKSQIISATSEYQRLSRVVQEKNLTHIQLAPTWSVRHDGRTDTPQNDENTGIVQECISHPTILDRFPAKLANPDSETIDWNGTFDLIDEFLQSYGKNKLGNPEKQKLQEGSPREQKMVAGYEDYSIFKVFDKDITSKIEIRLVDLNAYYDTIEDLPLLKELYTLASSGMQDLKIHNMKYDGNNIHLFDYEKLSSIYDEQVNNPIIQHTPLKYYMQWQADLRGKYQALMDFSQILEFVQKEGSPQTKQFAMLTQREINMQRGIIAIKATFGQTLLWTPLFIALTIIHYFYNRKQQRKTILNNAIITEIEDNSTSIREAVNTILKSYGADQTAIEAYVKYHTSLTELERTLQQYNTPATTLKALDDKVCAAYQALPTL